jgi:hypothetical protein
MRWPDTSLALTLIGLIVEWDQPYLTGAPGSPGSSSSIDFCVTGASKYTVINLDDNAMTCTGPNITGVDTNQPNSGDAEQVLILGNPANAAGRAAGTTISLIVGLAHSTPPPGRIKLVVADDGAGSVIQGFATNSPTLRLPRSGRSRTSRHPTASTPLSSDTSSPTTERPTIRVLTAVKITPAT